MDPEDARVRVPEAPGRAAANLDVLLAEDNEISALLARAVVEGVGHTVTIVRDGAAAVAEVRGRATPFPVILMDLHMPGLDGLAAARAIRAHEAEAGGARARLVALTADVLPETRTEARAAGIDSILEKPVSPDSLRRLLADLTEKRRGRASHGSSDCHQIVGNLWFLSRAPAGREADSAYRDNGWRTG